MIDWKGMEVLWPSITSMMAISISTYAIPNLLEQKACSPWAQPSVNEFICNDTAILTEISETAVTKNVLKSVCSAISTATFGIWRDTTGLSRPLLLIGSTAEILSTSAHFLAAADWRSSPWIAPMMEAVISGLFGEGIYLLGAYCILMSKTSVEHRTMSFQIYMSSILLASLVAASTSGYFLTTVGYQWVFATAIMLHFLTLLLCFICVKDTKIEREQAARRSTLDQLREMFKLRANIAVVWLMLLCSSIVSSAFLAESSLSVYYLQQRFHFTVKEASLYGSYHSSVALAGSFIMAILISKVLKWSDISFGILASFLTSLSSFLTAVANTTTLLFLSAPLVAMRLNLYSIPQSIISKCIKNDELGIFLGFGSVIGICVTFFLNFLYNYVFSLTSKTMPGEFYFVSAGCYVFLTILFSISFCLFKPSENSNCESRESDERIVNEDEQNFINSENT